MDRVLRAHPRSPDRALIVEDDWRVASLHRAFLEVEGLEVVGVAGSLEAALRALELARTWSCWTFTCLTGTVWTFSRPWPEPTSW